MRPWKQIRPQCVTVKVASWNGCISDAPVLVVAIDNRYVRRRRSELVMATVSQYQALADCIALFLVTPVLSARTDRSGHDQPTRSVSVLITNPANVRRDALLTAVTRLTQIFADVNVHVDATHPGASGERPSRGRFNAMLMVVAKLSEWPVSRSSHPLGVAISSATRC
jgi:hypothetical protein